MRYAIIVAMTFLKSLPRGIWYFLAGALLGMAVSLYGAGVWSTGDWVPTEVPTVAKKEKVKPEQKAPSPWTSLDIYEPPQDSVIIRDTVRIPKDVGEGPENGLTRATYDPELLQRPELTAPTPYAILPFRDGGRPDISVGLDKVSVRLVNPNTSGYMRYSYKVPEKTWEVTLSASLLYSNPGRSPFRAQISPGASLNISRKVGDYLVTGSGVLQTGESWWGAQLTIERPIWSR